VEAWDWFRGDGDHGYAFSGSTLRFSFGRQGKNLDWQIEMVAPLLLGVPDNAVAPGAQGQMGFGAGYFVANDRNRNAGMLFPKQGFIRSKNLGGKAAQSLRLGQMEFFDATEVIPKSSTLAAVKRDRLAQRLIGNFGWSHGGRKGLATMADVSVDYQIHQKVVLSFYLAGAWGGQVVQSTYPQGKNARLGFAELTYRF
jgi:hypothetical protein